MRIVTWNINGLRACLKRRFDGKLINLLQFLEADIICFQETKLARQEATEDLALADGWDSFFAFSQEELERLDSEGRVVMTDHGAFVLVNVYGPAISTEESAEERYAFKLRFYEGLLHRIQTLRASGRCVILLGDLNISLAPIDSCDPGPIDAFTSRTDRRLLTRLLTSNGGPFLDAYTCWSTASGARINNYGTRIDLILAAGPDGAAAGADFHDLFTAADDRMKPPLCKGHGEPCVIRQVKKGGVNQGKPPRLYHSPCWKISLSAMLAHWHCMRVCSAVFNWR
ncbi:DNase I-like protein [Coccomyxa subellipsoidea C-169]|uniref:DNase I-like protein n=1 Tax=Coccomyxa subellipsoidea (strain C-169) TaxID=574566 RepID=I0YP11_COCSC|nr:DNase I-like protein [Coccomyxa subellipsoidea C-169]EIE20130.1 DNase I-like protein [Coccomyxa subellipsoidea C-169]|eukprot:XP_005644674.1 DNase I-like protein [Coccomyxa subellipsoidea C-169]